MPVEAGTSEFTYLGDGVTKTFPFPSRFFSDDDLLVGVNNVEQDSSTYTVTGAGSATGGSVIFNAAPAVGAGVLLLRKPEASQLVDFVNGQTILEGTLDNALDRLTMLIQYMLRKDEGVIRLSDFDTQVSMQLPITADRSLKLMGFDADGKPIALNPNPVDNGYSTTDALIDVTPVGKAVVRAATQAAARAALGAMTSDNIGDTSITIAKLAAALLDGAPGSLIQWAVGPKYPAGDGSAITNLSPSQFTASLWPAGYLSGLTLSYVTNSTFSVAAGGCRNEDSGTAQSMSLAVPVTKNLNAWSSGLGSLDTGTIAVNTWYHVHLIRKNSDGSINVLLSLSPTAPSMPSGWTARRRIGAIRTDGSAQIVPFVQVGDEFQWVTPRVSYNAAPPATRTLVQIDAPPGVRTLARLRAYLTNNSTCYVRVTTTDEADVAPTWADNDCNVVYGVAYAPSVNLLRLTDTSQQIAIRASTAGLGPLVLNTTGWVDTRGKN